MYISLRSILCTLYLFAKCLTSFDEFANRLMHIVVLCKMPYKCIWICEPPYAHRKPFQNVVQVYMNLRSALCTLYFFSKCCTSLNEFANRLMHIVILFKFSHNLKWMYVPPYAHWNSFQHFVQVYMNLASGVCTLYLFSKWHTRNQSKPQQKYR